MLEVKGCKAASRLGEGSAVGGRLHLSRGKLVSRTTVIVHVPRGIDLIARHDREGVALDEILWLRNGQNIPIRCDGRAKRLAEWNSMFRYIKRFRNEVWFPSIEVAKSQSRVASPVPMEVCRIN